AKTNLPSGGEAVGSVGQHSETATKSSAVTESGCGSGIGSQAVEKFDTSTLANMIMLPVPAAGSLAVGANSFGPMNSNPLTLLPLNHGTTAASESPTQQQVVVGSSLQATAQKQFLLDRDSLHFKKQLQQAAPDGCGSSLNASTSVPPPPSEGGTGRTNTKSKGSSPSGDNTSTTNTAFGEQVQQAQTALL
ncbi:unnamed protein product, partial [Amoebophrya sp. A25]